jgi:hypothetical protein
VQLALHYSGAAAGPVKPFGIDVGDFAAESEHLLFPDPGLACARARVLEYFCQRNRGVAEDHMVLRFSEAEAVSAGDVRLVRQLCVQMGFRRSASPEFDAAAYISGAAPELLDNYPELGMFRDIVFYLKLMMCPSLEELPAFRRWEPRDAALQWSHETRTAGLPGFRKTAGEFLHAEAFGRRLSAAHPMEARERGVLSLLLGSGQKPRAPPSGADPETVVGPGVRCEDDVLHVPNSKLPSFGARLTHADTELLCQFLTVPYLRIPLLLDFFRLCCSCVFIFLSGMSISMYIPAGTRGACARWSRRICST